MKQLLAGQELVFPRLFASLQAAMKPLLARSTTGLESNRCVCVCWRAHGGRNCAIPTCVCSISYCTLHTHCSASQDRVAPPLSSGLDWTESGESSD